MLAAMVAAGVLFRASLAAFTLLWAGAYVAQTAHYNNPYYLILLLSGLLCTTPAAADSSFDAWRDPRRRSGTCPRWCYTIFIAQTAILYGYAAYAKLQPDWLAARPLALWLDTFAQIRPFGWIYSQPGIKWLLAWGGIPFDALVVPALLVRRTRKPAVAAAVAFHLFNSLTCRGGEPSAAGIGGPQEGSHGPGLRFDTFPVVPGPRAPETPGFRGFGREKSRLGC